MAKYARVLARTLPKLIETDADLKRMAAELEALDFADRELCGRSSGHWGHSQACRQAVSGAGQAAR